MADENFLGEIALVPNNTYNYSNSTVFYSMVNNNYHAYYNKVIRKSQEWLDGFDPSFHKAEKGILSSRIGAKITKGITNQIFGRGLVFINGKNTISTKGLNYISHEWQDKANFQNAVKMLIGYTKPLGTGLLKLNKDEKGELWVEPLRADYFYFSVDARGNLNDVKTFVKSFKTTEKDKDEYCVVEHRFFRKEPITFTKEINGKLVEFNKPNQFKKVPYVRYEVYRVDSTSQNNSLAANTGAGLDWKILPKDVQDSINSAYGFIIVGKDIKLPFHEYLGCELFKSSGGDITQPSTPFGEPMLFDLISAFMEYDLECSYSIRDLFNSKGVVGIPKSLTQSSLVDNTGGNLSAASPFGALNIPSYELVPGLDPNSQQPIINQFEMRAAEHEVKKNAILKEIATSVGMSPRVIASYLVDGNEKTAEQTHSEDDTITQWVKNNRQDYVRGLNKIIETVLSYNGIIDNVEVRFANDGLMDEERTLANIQTRMDLGLLDLEDAVREYYSDLDEEQLKLKIEKAKAQQDKNQQIAIQQFQDNFEDVDENEFNETDIPE